MPLPDIPQQAKLGRMEQKLLVIVVEGAKGRIYLPATPEVDATALSIAAPQKPDGDLPQKALGFRVQEYGMTRWRDLFTARQLVALNAFTDLVPEACVQAEGDARALGCLDDDRSTIVRAHVGPSITNSH